MRFFLPLVQPVRKYIELPHAFSWKRRENTVKQRKSFNSSRMLSCETLSLFCHLSAASRLQSAHRRLLFPLLFAYTSPRSYWSFPARSFLVSPRVICFYTPGANLLCNVFCSSRAEIWGKCVYSALGTRYTRALFEKLPHITPQHSTKIAAARTENLNRRRFHTFSICINSQHAAVARRLSFTDT